MNLVSAVFGILGVGVMVAAAWPHSWRRDLLNLLLRNMPAAREMYVVLGEPVRSGRDGIGPLGKAYKPPEYTTDPRHYGLPVFSRELSDEEFVEYYQEKVRAFHSLDHAAEFVYSCNLETVFLHVYVSQNGQWHYSRSRSFEAGGEIAWT